MAHLNQANHAASTAPSKSWMKTFADMAKKTKFKCGKGGVVTAAISPEIVFLRALSLARCRYDVSMATALGHPIGPVPMAIFHADGTMRKTNKAELGHQLEAQVDRVTEFNSFDTLALSYFKQLLIGFQKADTVVEVFDQYDNSVKLLNGSAVQDQQLIASSNR